MNYWKKLQNPFVLVGQGFVLGGILFFMIHADSLQASAGPESAAESLLPSAGAGR